MSRFLKNTVLLKGLNLLTFRIFALNTISTLFCMFLLALLSAQRGRSKLEGLFFEWPERISYELWWRR